MPDERDPWLPATMRARVALARSEARMVPAVRAAMNRYLLATRAAVLRHDTARVHRFHTRPRSVASALTAITAAPHPSELPPNLDAWPPQAVWDDAATALVLPVSTATWREGWTDQLTPEQAAQLNDADYVNEHLADTTERLTGATWPDDVYDTVRAEVADGLRAGENIADIRLRIAQVLQLDRWSARALSIARNEVMAARNGGAYQAGLARQRVFGEQMHKTWLAVMDRRTRPAHRSVHGTSVPADHAFSVGGESLRYPHDPRGSPAETALCRCVLNWYTSTESASGVQKSLYSNDSGGSDMGDTATDTPAAPVAASTSPPPAASPPVVTAADGSPATVTVTITEETETTTKVGKATTRVLPADDTSDSNGIDGGTSDEAMSAAATTATASPEPDSPPATTSMPAANSPAAEQPVAASAAAPAETVDPADQPETLTAGVSGSTSLTLAGPDVAWDAGEARKAMVAWANGDGSKLGQGFFWRDPNGDPATLAAYKLPFATVVNGRLVAVPQGVMAAAAVIQGGRGGANLPAADVAPVKSRIAGYYRKMNRTAPWLAKGSSGGPSSRTPRSNARTGKSAARVVRADAGDMAFIERVAANIPIEPDPQCFQTPPMERGTKMHVLNEQGWVAGYIADWDARHRVYQIPPPPDPYGGLYPKFHRHRVRCSDGSVVMTGPIATNGHGDPANTDLAAVMAHYDDPRYVAAAVRVVEDDNGIWASGTLRPGVSPFQVALLDTYSQSGHWMPGPSGHAQELVASCCVTVEAFELNPNHRMVASLAAAAGVTAPVLATAEDFGAVDDDGQAIVLVAAGIVEPEAAPVVTAALDPVAFFRQFKAVEKLDGELVAARRRVRTDPAVTAAATRIRGGA